MPLQSLVSRAFGRRKPDATDAPRAPRGSGSWANEWAEPTVSLASPRPAAASGPVAVASPAASHSTPRVRPLMGSAELALHDHLIDRLEAEAPACTLHAGVALTAILAIPTAAKGSLPNLVADLVIVDSQGIPMVALMWERPTDGPGHLAAFDALLDADLPVLSVPPRPDAATVWHRLVPHLSEEG
ncbi:MAG: hypothetical protein AAF264_12965 [Pseudomonadota bacterium]